MRAEIVPAATVDNHLLGPWRDLVAGAVEPNPFHQPEFLLPAVRRLADGADVGLLLVWSGSACAFLLPVVRSRTFRKVPVPTMAWWHHPYAYVGSPLVSRDIDAAATWDAALQFLAADRRIGALGLELVRTEGPVAEALRAACGTVHPPVIIASYERAVLRRRPAETYLDDRLGDRRRKSLRRSRRRLEDALGGAVRITDHAVAAADQSDADLDAAVDAFLAMEAAGWKGADGNAIACRAQHAAFFREIAAELRRSDQLELWSFGTPEQAAAYQCNIRAGDTVFHFKVAYDEGLSQWSPGVQLEIEMVAQFHRDRRLERIDSCTDPGAVVSETLYPDRE